MGVLPSPSPSLDMLQPNQFFFIKATPDIGTPSCTFLIIIRPPLKILFPKVPLYLENLVSQSIKVHGDSPNHLQVSL